MAASTGQGRSFATFLVGLTVACVGIAYLSTGSGKLALIVGAAILLVSLFGFLKIKPLEGKPAQKTSSTTTKLLGAFVAAFGWVLTLFGLHITQSVGGRIVLALVGIAVTLFGIIYILPAAFNKNAIWKT
jgi:hypothetical protein